MPEVTEQTEDGWTIKGRSASNVGVVTWRPRESG